MEYHICKQIPESIVKLCSNLMIDDDENKDLIEDVEDLLCSCMHSNYDELRIETYAQICKLTSVIRNFEFESIKK